MTILDGLIYLVALSAAFVAGFLYGLSYAVPLQRDALKEMQEEPSLWDR